jgi:predicted O-linked N-acetylglucosamine transferase (SPINDLY family)
MEDPLGRVILHGGVKESQTIYTKRLSRAGCDTARIHFLGALPHHQLLALYALSDVVLDSYPAGGCTTTREVLALGKALVTLPARLLGGRWSYAYYRIMEDDALNRLVIATSSEEYVKLAVKLGTSAEVRNEAESRIKSSVHKLYESLDSIRAWDKVFLDIAPVAIDESWRTGNDEL